MNNFLFSFYDVSVIPQDKYYNDPLICVHGLNAEPNLTIVYMRNLQYTIKVTAVHVNIYLSLTWH